MSPETNRPPSTRSGSLLPGPLLLAATLFVSIVAAGMTLLWLLDRSTDPGRGTVVVGVAAAVAAIVSAVADKSWSARVTRTTELGNGTRLFAVAAVLLLIPTVILERVEDDQVEPLPARGTAAACPPERVPEAAFDDLEAGSSRQRVAACLRWWGILAPERTTFAPGDTVLRGELATLLDRLAGAAGAPLPDVADVPIDPAVPDSAAIARVATAGMLGSNDIAAFDPARPVTRDELSGALAALHQHVTGSPLPQPEEAPFPDIEGNAHADAIEAVAAAGIGVGTAEGTFEPAAQVNRIQAGTMIARTLDLWVEEGVTALPA